MFGNKLVVPLNILIQNSFMKKFLSLLCLVYFCKYAVLFAQDGDLDTSFDPGTGANDLIGALAIQNDGKILIGGHFTIYNGYAGLNGLTRLNTDGSRDAGFNVTGLTGAGITRIVVQNDGKIVVGANQFASNLLKRLNADGSLDASFATLTPNQNVQALALQADGKILVGGLFTSINSTTLNKMARLNTDGSIDNTFNMGTGFSGGHVYNFAVQPDGKIIVVGTFTSYNGFSVGRIVRLNSDGTIDNAFRTNNNGGANNHLEAVCIQPDGKILIGGQLTSFGGVTRNGLCRLNSDGTLDTSFDVGTGCAFVRHLEYVNSGSNSKIYVAGQFTTYNSITMNHLARINTDGSIDPTYNPSGTGPNDYLRYALVQNDGKVVICGAFTSYKSTTRNRVARIQSSVAPVSINLPDGQVDQIHVHLYPNPNNGLFTIEKATNEVLNYDLINVHGQVLYFGTLKENSNFIDVTSLAFGNYYIRVFNQKGRLLKTVIFVKE